MVMRKDLRPRGLDKVQTAMKLGKPHQVTKADPCNLPFKMEMLTARMGDKLMHPTSVPLPHYYLC